MDLLERQSDLDVLESALDAAGRGSGSVVLVGGEAGIGKTRLVRRFADDHDDETRILWGACDDLSTPRTLGPFHDIALQIDGPLRDAVDTGTRSEVFDSTLRSISNEGSPTVVVIEDVHWADGATLDVLKFLGRRIERVGAVLILTYRTEEVSSQHQLMLVIGDLPAPAVHRLMLSPLTEAAVAELAAGYGGSAEDLFIKTRGNPFLVTEALMTGDVVPANVRDAVRTRAARLLPAGRAVAEFLAVVPSQTERWLLEGLPNFEPAALDECRERGLIEFDTAAAWYRHELVRGAMEDSLVAERRRELNALALARLIEREADVARIVHHARGAGDTEAIARYAPIAGRQASAATAHREALAHFRVAAEASDDLGPEKRARLLTEYTIECYFVNEAFEGLVVAERALALWQGLGETTMEGDVLRWMSRLHWWLGHNTQAEETGLAAVNVLSAVPRSRELAMAYSNLAQIFMLAQRADDAEAWATRAITVARELDDQNTLAHALNNLGSTRLRVGDMTGTALLEESLEIAVQRDFDDSAGRAYVNLVWNALDYREYQRAERYIGEGLEYARRRELAGSINYLTAERARWAFDRGLWKQAEEDARWVLGRPEEPGITQMPAHATLARLQVRRGDPNVDVTLGESWRVAEQTGELQRIAPLAVARAELAWLRDDQSGILSSVADGYQLAIDARQPWVTDELAFWMWRGAGATQPLKGPMTPFALQMRGDWREAAEAWAQLGCPYEQAVALMDGEDSTCLLEALEILDALGAAPAAAILRRRLRSMGVQGVPRGARHKTRAHPAGLTPRQVEVLELVAEGLTNAEIAERLFVSPKTVDHHVSALLTKMEVSSRTEASALARDQGFV